MDFTIVDNETIKNWAWFLATLGEALYSEDDYKKVIAFVLDKSKGQLRCGSLSFHLAWFLLPRLDANFMKRNTRLGKALREGLRAIIT